MSAATVTRHAVIRKFDAKPKSALVDVTPAQAKKWLEQNVKNRPLRSRVVDGYARDMASGSWQVTGDAVKFAFDGSLLDGQHRLAAVVQSGTTVQMFVIRGLHHDAQEVMDSGAKRQASDALGLRGYHNTTLLAATARMALTVEAVGYGGIVGKQHAFTTSEIAAFVDDHDELAVYMQPGAATARQLDSSPTVVCYAMWRLYSLNPDAANEFFADCREGVGLDSGDPVLALRRRFAEARRTREYVSQGAALSLIFRAWNARREGKPLHRLQIVSRTGELTIPEPRA